MKNLFRNNSYILLLLTLILPLNSCKKLLLEKPEVNLAEENMYRNVYDADAAVIGVYGKLSGLAEQYVVLNEVRADLVEVTSNASPYLKQLSTHEVTADNPYASPKPFYSVIINCNDVLSNFDQMLKDKKMTRDEYNVRYSDVGAIRSWLYLQLGIHFGTIPYVTDPLKTVEDVKNKEKYPRLSFNELLAKLISFTESLPVLTLYPTSTSLVTTVDGTSTAKIFINKQILLGDLYLWNGQYLKSATCYKQVMESASESSNLEDKFETYKLGQAKVADNNDLAVGYIRYKEQDINSLINSNSQGWKSIFGRSQDFLWNTELIWAIPFNKDFKPTNPFINLFAVNGGNYLLKPSQLALDNWNNEHQRNGIPYDARGQFSYTLNNGQAIISKYQQYYNAELPLEKNGYWYLYRAAELHLHYMEAANRDGKGKVAWALLNTGIGSTYDDATLTDKTNVQQTHEPFPYDFDARNGTIPYFRGNWHRNGGIRGRAYVTFLSDALQTQTLGLEDAIIKEGALELAFEGNRWSDLLRIALRRNDPSFLADKIAIKLSRDGIAGAQQTHQFLMNPQNWYLPFSLD